jgi:hypothetical protein
LKYSNEIPDPKTRRFQELNGIQGRCVTCIGRAETDSQQSKLSEAARGCLGKPAPEGTGFVTLIMMRVQA